jgi:dipeptidyl-peptidase-4
MVGGRALAAERLTIERVGALPNLSGTPPVSPVWSPKGRELAFLWNDSGWPFRDLWTVSVSDGAPIRLTDMAADLRSPESPEDNNRSRGGIAEAVWTPDGEELVFNYEAHLFQVEVSSRRVRRFTDRSADRHALGFSPDGNYLSYLEEGDLWLWHQHTGERVPATKLAVPAIGTIPGALFSRRDVEVSAYRWSPDARYVALQIDDRRTVRREAIPDYLGDETRLTFLRRAYPGQNDHVREIGVYSVTEGRLRRVVLPEPTDRRIHAFTWSPGNQHLLVDQSSEDATERILYLVHRETLATRELWRDHRPRRTTQLWNSAWLSDGRIVFVADTDGRHHLYTLGLDGSPPEQLTEGNWEVVAESAAASVAVSPRKEIFFVSSLKSPYERQVYRLPEEGGAIVPISSLAGVHSFFLSPDGSRLALLRSSDLSPTELYLLEPGPGAAERQVTRSPLPEFLERTWIAPRYVTFPSHIDGETLHGRLLVPPALEPGRKYPVIVGPVYPNTVRNRWGDREESRGLYTLVQQYLALERGYIGFHVDVRGSVGYSRAFHDRLYLDYGGIDVDDLESGTRYLKTLPYVDPDRIGIWGSSYGGLMTLLSLFNKPGLYRAGVAAAPVSDFRHVTPGVAAVVRRPQAHPEAHRRGSAIHQAEGLRDPLLILHGMQDSIVLFKDSVALAEKLMLLGKDFDFVVSPGSTHLWSQQDYVAVHFLRKLAAHFEQHLGGPPR